MKRSTSIRTFAWASLAVATIAHNSFAQEEPAKPARTDAAPVSSSLDFRSYKFWNDRKIYNTAGDHIATASDFLIDRGSGTIQYLIIKTGMTLGLSGRMVAVPYSAAHWGAENDRLTLTLNPDEIKQSPNYSEDNWIAAMPVKEGDTRALRTILETEGMQGIDIEPVAVGESTKAKVAGEITNVERVYADRQENLVVTVQATDGTVQRFTLGPSWFINGTGVGPMRGDTVALDTLVALHNDEANTTVTVLRNGQEDIALRDANGRPAWGLKSIQLGSETYASPYWRFVPASRLKGMRVVARGIECGTVNDIIFDRNSARVAFLSIDVDPKFIDAAQGRRLVPWSVVSVTLDGVARIDADRDMVSTSIAAPADLMQLTVGTDPEKVYKAYKIPTPKYDTTDGRR